MANVENLQHVLEWTTDHIESHHQPDWASLTEETRRAIDLAPIREWHAVPACGASHCLFGNAAILNGYTFVAKKGSYGANNVIRDEDLDILAATGLANPRDAMLVGAEIFDLDGDDADLLSHADNSLADLWAIAWSLTGGSIVLRDSLPEGALRHPEDCGMDGCRVCVPVDYGSDVPNLPRHVRDWAYDHYHMLDPAITKDVLDALGERAAQLDVAKVTG